MTEAQVYNLSPTGVDGGLEDPDLMSTATGRTGFTTGTAVSMADKSVSSMASSIGIKFGDIPTSPMAPSYTFGTGDRKGSKKVRRIHLCKLSLMKLAF